MLLGECVFVPCWGSNYLIAFAISKKDKILQFSSPAGVLII